MCDKVRAYKVERYSPERKAAWDAFLIEAKNATFLFRRDYMDYHSDRFADHSLMIYCDGELAGVLPANLAADGTLISHEGLTYGGLAVRRAATMTEVLAGFHACLSYLDEQNIAKVLYKRCPSFYSTLPDDEMAYAFFVLEAQLCRRDCAMVVNLAERLPLRKDRRTGISKAQRSGVRVLQESNFAPFWEQVLAPRLAGRYGAKPVHTVAEITLLARRFPEQIKQFSAYCGDEIVAGTTIYETPQVAHSQYSAVSERGRKLGALDFLYGWLIDVCYKAKRFFDFGTCNENQGRRLNHGLLDWKEAFGGRCYAHDFYEVATRNHAKLQEVLPARGEPAGKPSDENHAALANT
jgi:hypothetical protein